MSLIDVEGFQMVQTHLNLLVDAVGNQPAALSTHSTLLTTPIYHAYFTYFTASKMTTCNIFGLSHKTEIS